MRLSKTKAKAVKAAPDAEVPELLPDGVYRAQLVEVAAKTGKTSGEPYWAWKFKLAEKGWPTQHIWENASLAGTADFKMKQIFTAFGVDPYTDTDELIGDYVLLKITHGTQQQGANAGSERNEIAAVLPLDDDAEEAEDDDEDDAEEDDDEEDSDDEDDEEAEEPPPPPKRKTPKAKPEPEPEPEDDDDEDEDDEEEAPPPPKRRAKLAAAPAPAARRKKSDPPF